VDSVGQMLPLDSGSSVSNDVEVRVLFFAPLEIKHFVNKGPVLTR